MLRPHFSKLIAHLIAVTAVTAPFSGTKVCMRSVPHDQGSQSKTLAGCAWDYMSRVEPLELTGLARKSSRSTRMYCTDRVHVCVRERRYPYLANMLALRKANLGLGEVPHHEDSVLLSLFFRVKTCAVLWLIR